MSVASIRVSPLQTTYMPIRIYTTAPARDLMDERPFAITAWADDTHQAEVYAIVYLPDGTPVLRGHEVSLTAMDIEGGREHAMRLHLARLWTTLSDIECPPLDQLLEEIPVEEFALTQIEKSSIRGVVAQISLEAQSDELANAFAAFPRTS